MIVLKPNCVSCDATLEMNEERFRDTGNYCDKCDSRAERMAFLRVKVRSPHLGQWEKDLYEEEFRQRVAECKQYIDINFAYIGASD